MGVPGSGRKVGDFECSTAIDEFFSKLAVSYNTFDNQFLRAEIADKMLIRILEKFPDFRKTTVKGQSDMEWFDGKRWNEISIKYKGPNTEKGLPKAPLPSGQLSALAWSKNASGKKPTELTCNMLVIWDAWMNPNQTKATKQLHYPKGLVIVTPDLFNNNVTYVKEGKQNKTNSAFKISTIIPSLEDSNCWIRNLGNKSPAIISPIEDLGIDFTVLNFNNS